jgi:hypothetical protein
MNKFKRWAYRIGGRFSTKTYATEDEAKLALFDDFWAATHAVSGAGVNRRHSLDDWMTAYNETSLIGARLLRQHSDADVRERSRTGQGNSSVWFIAAPLGCGGRSRSQNPSVPDSN